jgi:hypothetical protein
MAARFAGDEHHVIEAELLEHGGLSENFVVVALGRFRVAAVYDRPSPLGRRS